MCGTTVFPDRVPALQTEMKAAKLWNLTGDPGRPALPGEPGLPLMPGAPCPPEKQ